MYIRRFCEIYVPVISFIVFINTLSFIFFVRRPAVLVSDKYFSELYGQAFERIDRLEASFKIFRTIKLVRIMEDTDILTITESINAATSNPYAVFFPNAYSDAADYYAKNIVKENGRDTKTFLLLDKSQPALSERPYYYVRNDADIDFHRAGSCAAALATISTVKSNQNKSIYFISSYNINHAEKESFAEGLQEGGFQGHIDFISGYENRNWENAAAVVIYGPAPAFLQSQANVHAVLFTWYNNTAYMPKSVKVIVDDSPYYSIPIALRMESKSSADTKGFAVPSKFIVLDERIADRAVVVRLLRASSVFRNLNS